GGDVAAHAQFGATIADEHLAFDHTRRAGDGVGLGLVDGDHIPELLARGRVECDEPAVDGADEYLALPHGHPAIHHVAAGVHAELTWHFGIEVPQWLAGFRLVGFDLAPRRGNIDDAIDHDGRGFLAAIGIHVREPGEAEFADIVLGDLCQRAVALLGVGAAMAHPRT